MRGDRIMFMIATRPGRTVRKSKNRVQKYAQVQSSGKFKWITDPNAATVFKTASDLLKAVGLRASEVDKITGDITWAEVETQNVNVRHIYNGH
jgi:hypothetical protein